MLALHRQLVTRCDDLDVATKYASIPYFGPLLGLFLRVDVDLVRSIVWPLGGVTYRPESSLLEETSSLLETCRPPVCFLAPSR